MNKGFLLTDATGNVIYVPISHEAAKDIAHAVNHADVKCVRVVNSLKTVQRHIINQYISAKTEEEFLEGIAIKL